MADPITNPATPEAIFGKDAVTAAMADHIAIGGLIAALFGTPLITWYTSLL